jgi:hypothetical protein
MSSWETYVSNRSSNSDMHIDFQLQNHHQPSQPEALYDDQPASVPLSQQNHVEKRPNKRPRRRYDEVDRTYKCGWKEEEGEKKGCLKGYETLSHLNTHIQKKKHGSKRTAEGRFYT